MAKIKKIAYRTRDHYYESHMEYINGVFFVRIATEHLHIYESGAYTTNCTQRRIAGKQVQMVVGKTEVECTNNWNTYMKVFFENSVKKEKVILYHMDYSSKTRNACDDGGKRKKEKYNHEWNQPDPKIEIEFDWMICTKSTVLSESMYYKEGTEKRINDGVGDSIGGGYKNKWIEVPYSKENEEFFIHLYASFESLMDKFYNHLGNKSKILNAIKSTQKLLS